MLPACNLRCRFSMLQSSPLQSLLLQSSAVFPLPYPRILSSRLRQCCNTATINSDTATEVTLFIIPKAACQPIQSIPESFPWTGSIHTDKLPATGSVFLSLREIKTTLFADFLY